MPETVSLLQTANVLSNSISLTDDTFKRLPPGLCSSTSMHGTLPEITYRQNTLKTTSGSHIISMCDVQCHPAYICPLLSGQLELNISREVLWPFLVLKIFVHIHSVILQRHVHLKRQLGEKVVILCGAACLRCKSSLFDPERSAE